MLDVALVELQVGLIVDVILIHTEPYRNERTSEDVILIGLSHVDCIL